jgi:hypothetical protein
LVKNLRALVQTLAHENNLLHPYDTRESPDFIGIFKKNQQVRKYLEIALLLLSSFTAQILLQTFAIQNKIHVTHCNASKARQRVTLPVRFKYKQIWGFINLLRRRL